MWKCEDRWAHAHKHSCTSAPISVRTDVPLMVTPGTLHTWAHNASQENGFVLLKGRPLRSHPKLCHPCPHTLEETLAFSSSTRVHTAGCRATNFQSLHTSAARSRVLVSR